VVIARVNTRLIVALASLHARQNLAQCFEREADKVSEADRFQGGNHRRGQAQTGQLCVDFVVGFVNGEDAGNAVEQIGLGGYSVLPFTFKTCFFQCLAQIVVAGKLDQLGIFRVFAVCAVIQAAKAGGLGQQALFDQLGLELLVFHAGELVGQIQRGLAFGLGERAAFAVDADAQIVQPSKPDKALG